MRLRWQTGRTICRWTSMYRAVLLLEKEYVPSPGSNQSTLTGAPDMVKEGKSEVCRCLKWAHE
eukprot:6209731-Pleurochrysis_carterae.AAC.4